jgi:hypothetical protein
VANPRLILAPFVLLLSGCPDAPLKSSPCYDGTPPTLIIGTGETEFVSLENSEGELPKLEIIHGPQGGYHTLLGFQVRNMDSLHFISMEATASIDEVPIASAGRWLSFDCNKKSGQLEAANAYLIYNALPEELHEQVTVIDVLVRDNDGLETTATLTARLVDPTLE